MGILSSPLAQVPVIGLGEMDPQHCDLWGPVGVHLSPTISLLRRIFPGWVNRCGARAHPPEGCGPERCDRDSDSWARNKGTQAAGTSGSKMGGLPGRSFWEAGHFWFSCLCFSAALPVSSTAGLGTGQDLLPQRPLGLEILACPSIWLTRPGLLGELPLVRLWSK